SQASELRHHGGHAPVLSREVRASTPVGCRQGPGGLPETVTRTSRCATQVAETPKAPELALSGTRLALLPLGSKLERKEQHESHSRDRSRPDAGRGPGDVLPGARRGDPDGGDVLRRGPLHDGSAGVRGAGGRGRVATGRRGS